MGESITYGLGGYDPSKPNNNITETLLDNGDGTGIHTDHTTDPPTVTAVTGLYIEEPLPDSAEVVAAQAILEEVQSRLEPSGVNSIAEMKQAVVDGMSAAVSRLRGE